MRLVGCSLVDVQPIKYIIGLETVAVSVGTGGRVAGVQGQGAQKREAQKSCLGIVKHSGGRGAHSFGEAVRKCWNDGVGQS